MKNSIRDIEILIDMKNASRWSLSQGKLRQNRLFNRVQEFFGIVSTSTDYETYTMLHPYCYHSSVENTWANGSPLGCIIKLDRSICDLEIIGEDRDRLMEDAAWVAANIIEHLHRTLDDILLTVRLYISYIDQQVDGARYVYTDRKGK